MQLCKIDESHVFFSLLNRGHIYSDRHRHQMNAESEIEQVTKSLGIQFNKMRALFDVIHLGANLC